MRFKVIHEAFDDQGELISTRTLPVSYENEVDAQNAIREMDKEEPPEEFQDENNLYWAKTADGIFNRYRIETE